MTTIETTTATAATTIPGVDLPAPGAYAIDASHSSVAVVARHLMVTKVRGAFTGVAGIVHVDDDWSQSSVAAVIGAATIDTGSPDRDGHLRSPDFLDVERFPELRFASTAIEHVKGDRFRLTGDLTIKDVTRPVTFDLEFLGTVRDPWGNDRIAFSASGGIDREDWGITWNVALETGGVLVSKKLQFELEVQAVRQAEDGAGVDAG